MTLIYIKVILNYRFDYFKIDTPLPKLTLYYDSMF
jgi:hypothetical protein